MSAASNPAGKSTPLKHLSRLLGTVAAVLAAAVPAVLADPAVRSLIANHPFVAAYLPLVSGVVVAVYRAARKQP